MPGFLPPGHFLALSAYDPDNDGDDDSRPETDADHDWWSADGKPLRPQGMRKGAPFAGYEDFGDCTEENSGKQDPDAYCGEIKHRAEGSARQAASGLPQIQQHTDPNNRPVPEDDELPPGVAFPLGDNAPSSPFREQWSTGPDGPQARTGARADMEEGMAEAMASADVSNGRSARHQGDFGSNAKQHGKYLRAWNNLAGLVHGLTGRAPLSKGEYGKQTGRPDLHSHYLSAYAQGYQRGHLTPRADDGGQVTASLRTVADTWSQPHQSTDDFDPPYNSPQTSPEPWSANASPEASDFAAGVKAGQSDKSAGEHPLFADNSSGVSPYVKGYAQGYGQPGQFGQDQDVPRSMGGDSGQAYNAQHAQQSFQVARASKTASAQDAWAEARDSLEQQHDVQGGHPVSGAPGPEKLEGEGTGGRSGATWKTSSLRRASASFAPDSLMRDPDFSRAYKFAQIWEPGLPLVKQGSARFEAGLYAGITDRGEDIQNEWIVRHWTKGTQHPELTRRISLHHSFTRKHAARNGIRAQGVYVRQGGTMTDLITDGPGTSPDPMGATPLNGPGTPPPMGGLSQPAAPGGAPPYQGAAPLPGGPVVPDDVMGRAQEPATPDGAFTNTFSGNHPENAVLAPVAPNKADQGGYSNHDAYQGDPHGNDRLAAFRNRVQASLAQSGAR